jgi:short subunit dehydrogenase-like uncharacterized protein
MASTFLIYGATGYTGGLIAREAARRGLRPILAGRRAEAVEVLGRELGLSTRAFALEDPALLAEGLADVAAVMHCAGPFGRTSRPMVDACLARGVHYLDITGEMGVFEALAARDGEARSAGAMLLPGAGFDVVPSDCLAAHLARRLPGAVRLALGFEALGRPSHGTATTMLENLPHGGAVRRGGRIVRVPHAYRTRTIDFGRGGRRAVTIPWGDVSTAFHSTGIPDIEVYMAAPLGLRLGLRVARHLRAVLGSRAVQGFLQRRIDAGPSGPSAEHRAHRRSRLWGEVADAAGRTAVSRLSGPESYDLTVLTTLAALERVLAGDAKPGFQTPSRAFGADFILSIPGVERTDEDEA